jgi:hypothetical protein
LALAKAWRELHRTRFAELLLDCGVTQDPGVRFSEELGDWSQLGTSADQRRIERYIDRFDLRNKRILHIGIGNSGLAKRFAHRVVEIVGTTVDDPEIRVAEATGLGNYAFVKHNKYSGDNDMVPGRFDVIIDNNPTSPCCCMRHLGTLFHFYVEKLAPGGFIVTDREGLEWIPDGSPDAWSFDFEDLSAVAAAEGLRTFRVARTVYVMTFTTPPKPTAPSLLRHAARRARALPGKLARRGPREAARMVRAVLMATVPWAVPTRFRPGRSG